MNLVSRTKAAALPQHSKEQFGCTLELWVPRRRPSCLMRVNGLFSETRCCPSGNWVTGASALRLMLPKQSMALCYAFVKMSAIGRELMRVMVK